MIFARFAVDATEHYGILKGEAIVELKGSLLEEPEETGALYDISEVKLLFPIVPSKIVCVGHNYLSHIEELGVKVPAEPVLFLKPPSCLIAPEEAIVFPENAKRVDYEGELAVVIGKKMKRVPEDEVMNYILGYSCFNDVTERALISENPLLLAVAKGFDTFGPFGPYLVTDLDPNRLEVKTCLNGVVMQHDNTKNCVFSVSKILSYVSRGMTLWPGDIVITGTPRGIAPMKPGDIVEVEIEGIGRLKNTVRSS